MFRKGWILVAALMLLISCTATAMGDETMTAYERYLAGEDYPSLAEHYEGVFSIGVATSPVWLANAETAALIAAQFNSLTCENEMKADFVMDRQATIRQGDPERVALNFFQADKVLSFAMEHGMGVRAHTLVWHSQAPRWFFTADWSNAQSAQLADRDTMIARMENYIRDEMTYVNEKYPGVIYAWDVVNEGIEPAHKHPAGLRTEDSLWYQTIGDDYIELAFTFARQYAAEGQKLFYNDYNCCQKDKIGPLRSLLKGLRDKGILDGLGMQSHLGIDSPTQQEYETALDMYAGLGITIHVTELDIKTTDNTALGQMKLAVRYRNLFALLQRMRERAGYAIESVTIWGLTDDRSWLSSATETTYLLLFDRHLAPKPAFFGALQDAAIPTMAGEAKLQEAIDRLQLNQPNQGQEDSTVTAYKALSDHNPVMVQRFGADPWAMVYGDRVYLYMTGDEPVINLDGSVQTNTYGNINTLRVLSSDDLVNWTDHGDVAAAGSHGAATWAANSWAPCAAWKNIDGKDRFFLYFANSGGGIGVLTSDSPTGPFLDPLGKALISRATPTCASVTWLFDPAVLVDKDGSAYLYFGGGIPTGKEAAPGTARVVKLGADMISLDGDPVVIDAPWLFEDSGINRFGDTYVYSYCSNFNVPAAGSEQGFLSGEIVYMTSDGPMGPFTFGGRVLKNPSAYFGVGGNNHHAMFEFQGRWYITYHAATLDKARGWNAGYRSTFVDELRLNENGLPTLSEGTFAGAAQVKPLDPCTEQQAETLAALAGVVVEPAEGASGQMAVRSTAAGGWIGVAGADFGAEGAGAVSLTWRSPEAGSVSLLLDDPEGEPVAAWKLPAAADWRRELFALPVAVTGTHDLIFRFEQADITLDKWGFTQPVRQ